MSNVCPTNASAVASEDHVPADINGAFTTHGSFRMLLFCESGCWCFYTKTMFLLQVSGVCAHLLHAATHSKLDGPPLSGTTIHVVDPVMRWAFLDVVFAA